MEQVMAENKIIAEMLFYTPNSRISNALLHIIHYPVYSSFNVFKSGLEPNYYEWDYTDLEAFIKEQLSVREIRNILYGIEVIFNNNHDIHELIRMLFANIRSMKPEIIKQFTSLCYKNTK
jgi:hypothetical protein